MFRIREIIQQDRLPQASERYLPLAFPSWAEAVAHVQLLQAQFLHRGQDQERTIWWGRDYGSFQVYQWMVEDAANEWQQ